MKLESIVILAEMVLLNNSQYATNYLLEAEYVERDLGISEDIAAPAFCSYNYKSYYHAIKLYEAVDAIQIKNLDVEYIGARGEHSSVFKNLSWRQLIDLTAFWVSKGFDPRIKINGKEINILLKGKYFKGKQIFTEKDLLNLGYNNENVNFLMTRGRLGASLDPWGECTRKAEGIKINKLIEVAFIAACK